MLLECEVLDPEGVNFGLENMKHHDGSMAIGLFKSINLCGYVI